MATNFISINKCHCTKVTYGITMVNLLAVNRLFHVLRYAVDCAEILSSG
jgi:hypothetical protein